VAQVGRRIAEKLWGKQQEIAEEAEGLDPDVVEAACLAHDLGHPPFGHVAEEELNSLSSAVGGFEGNGQSFRIVTKLAFRTPKYLGINLTRATLAAILKYPWFRGMNPAKSSKWGAYLAEADDFEFARELVSTAHQQRSAEAELMDWSDDVTYSVHDIEDFYRAGRIPLHLLARRKPDDERKFFFDDVFNRRKGQPGIWSKFDRAELEQAFTDIIVLHFRLTEPYSGTQDQRSRLRTFTGRLIGRYTNGIELARPAAASDARVQIREEHLKEVAMLKELTWTYIIGAPSLATQQFGQRHVIRELFTIFHEAASRNAKMLPVYYRERLATSSGDNDRTRVIIDFIASMTERQAIALYHQVKGVSLGLGLESIVI
jgi:dGTPase